MSVQAVTASGSFRREQRDEIVRLNARAHAALVARLRRARKEGDLPTDASRAILARFLTTIAQGVSIQAMLGVPRKELRAMADFALKSWLE
jgi:hypothetical protein